MNEILIENNISNVEEFKEALEKREEYDRLIDRYESNNKLLLNIIDGNDIDALAKKFEGEDIDENTLNLVKSNNGNIIDDDVDVINDEITNVSAKLSRINGILEESNSFNEMVKYINRKFSYSFGN